MSVIEDVTRFVIDNAPLTVITGAGCSTESGIFDYRDNAGNWKRAAPVHLPEFVRSIAMRRIYWSRSMLGWPRFAQAKPNKSHEALVELEQRGLLHMVISQNVDNLHQIAGQQNLIALHGSLATVTCMDCGMQQMRSSLQESLEERNQSYLERIHENKDANGEAEFTTEIKEDFVVPACSSCAGILKPDVVFFGESVPRDRVLRATNAVSKSNGVLVVGTSLMVYSGFRFVRQAHVTGKPLAAINVGATRADDWLEVKAESTISMTLNALCSRLPASPTNQEKKHDCE